MGPSSISGSISIPPSKSFLHRAVICAALAGGKSEIYPIVFSDDVLATINAVKNLGVDVNIAGGDRLTLHRGAFANKQIDIDCGDCASTLRFLIPIASALGINVKFKRSISLAKRPIKYYLEVLASNGLNYKLNSDNSIDVSGKLQAGKFSLRGDISSQFISGLLLTLPLLDDDSETNITSKLESEAYVDMTIAVMKNFGVEVEKKGNNFYIKGKQEYKACKYHVEGDWSQAAFFMAAAAINGNIRIKNLNKNSLQGDKKILDLLSDFGANIYWDAVDLCIKKSKLQGINIDASQIPDLVPILSVVAAYANGTTKINNATRLKYKECDRLKAIYLQLKSLGVDIEKFADGLAINGNKSYNGGVLSSHKDHRMVMALSVMALRLKNSLKILDAQSINKSYPNFFRDYNSIGGKSSVLDLGK